MSTTRVPAGDEVAVSIPIGEQLARIAAETPERVALVVVDRQGHEQGLTYAELDRAANRAARVLAAAGVDTDSTVVIGLPSSPAHVIATWGAWKCGALVLPLSATLPAPERDALLEVTNPTVVVCAWDDAVAWPRLVPERLTDPTVSDAPVPSRTPHPGKAVSSGGSTGRPKIIVDVNPLRWTPGRIPPLFAHVGLREGQVQLVCGPMYHNAGFAWTNMAGIPNGHTVVLMERFDAALAVDLIERHRVNFALIVPTMMRRILDVPGVRGRDLSSIESILHTAAPCDAGLKREFIDLVGAEKVWEGFGATEAVGICLIRGDEWLEHPSVGRPFACDMRIVGEDGRDCDPGEVGEVYMRPHGAAGAPFRYVGDGVDRTIGDEFRSVGDLGWVDPDGYLHVADRRTDLIITGGSNVYPAEVEMALLAHPAVIDAAAIGLSDRDRGQVVHAIVELAPAVPAPSAEELIDHCRSRLAAYKVPRSLEIVERLPRNDVGKLPRAVLREERERRPRATLR